MDSKKLKAIATAMLAAAEQLEAAGNAFRLLGGDDEGEGGDGSTGKPVRAGKSSAKPATKSAGKKAPAKDEDEDLSEDDIREALKELAEAKGKGALVAALAAVGAGSLGDVDESQYAELKEKIDEIAADDVDYDEEPAPKGKKAATPAKKTAGKAKKPAVDQDTVTERFTELVEADKPAAVALLKKLKVKKFSELDEDSDWEDILEKVNAAFPEDDDDLV